MEIKHNGKQVDVKSFVEDNLKRELAARGLPVKLGARGDDKLILNSFEVLSNRVTSFSPMVTVSTARADLVRGSSTTRLTSMVKRGKVPVWTMSEINEPCYNEPIELMLKELVAKLNMALYNYSMTDDYVLKLIDKVKSEANDSKLAYMDVYELGFSNNKKAIPGLFELSKHKNDYVRLAAISSLGILKASDHLAYLKGIARNAKLWQDRATALKAIGDIGSSEALGFLQKERSKWAGNDSKEATWNVKIIDLYLG